MLVTTAVATNIWIDDQTLHEVYLAPFAAAVEAGVASVMCSYNQLNGTFSCANAGSLIHILRDELGFKGFVATDYGATHAVTFINAGLDMDMPGPGGRGHLSSIRSRLRKSRPRLAMREISRNSKIACAVNDDFTGVTVPAAALSHDGKLGLQRTSAAGAALQTDAQLDFTTKGGNALPANSTLTWKGTLTVPHTGSYRIYLQALGTNANISLDGELLGSTGHSNDAGEMLQANSDNEMPTVDGLDNFRLATQLAAGAHVIQVKITSDTSNAPVRVRLNWYRRVFRRGVRRAEGLHLIAFERDVGRLQQLLAWRPEVLSASRSGPHRWWRSF
jgi:hypothetical protein